MSILIKPIISEKATKDSELKNRYAFFVHPDANKIQIKKEIQGKFGVDVLRVRTLIVAPDVKVKYTKKGLQVGKSNKYKKAMIDVKEGQSIDVFANY